MASSVTGCKGMQGQTQILPWLSYTVITAEARAPQLRDSFRRNMTLTCAGADSWQERGGAGGTQGHSAATQWYLHAVQGPRLSTIGNCVESCMEQMRKPKNKCMSRIII